MEKRSLSERDICTKFITPALRKAGWDEITQIREEVSFTKGRIIVRGKLVSRGKGKRADYILSVKPNIPIAIVEAKENSLPVAAGMQQGLEYAETLGIPFVFSSNGDGFVFHDRTGLSPAPEKTLALDEFPSPSDLWARYRAWKGLSDHAAAVTLQDYFDDGSGKSPRYYQVNAVNAAIEAIRQAQPGEYPLVVTSAERSTCDHFDFEGAAAIIPLVSSTGHGNASINRLHYQEGKFALGTILVAAFPYDPELISAHFLFEYLSAFKEELLVSRMTGTANVTLSVGRVAEVPVPLICPEVQRKVDALMALCDQLEASLTIATTTRSRLLEALLHEALGAQAEAAA